MQWVQPWKSPETATDANTVILFNNRAVLSLIVRYTITHTHSNLTVKIHLVAFPYQNEKQMTIAKPMIKHQYLVILKQNILI